MPSAKKQIGSGFTFNQSDVIGGQMSRVGYSECDTPSYYNKYMVYDTAAPVQQTAGARRSRRSIRSTHRKVKSKSKSKSKSVKRESRKRSKSVKRDSRKRSKVSKSKRRLSK